jgi:glycerol-3-phosphate dehydrogenase subunit C
MLTSTDTVGSFAGIPVVAQTVNAANASAPAASCWRRRSASHADAPVPQYHSNTARKRLKRGRERRRGGAHRRDARQGGAVRHLLRQPQRAGPRRGPGRGVRAQRHPGPARRQGACCGMPKLELGDLEAVAKLKESQHPGAEALIDEGYDIVAPVPVLRADVQAGAAADVPGRRRRPGGQGAHLRPVRVPDAAPQGRAAEDRLQAKPLGKVSYHVPATCACRTSA